MVCKYCRQVSCESCPRCIHHPLCLGCNKEFETDSLALVEHYICPACFKKIEPTEPISHSWKVR